MQSRRWVVRVDRKITINTTVMVIVAIFSYCASRLFADNIYTFISLLWVMLISTFMITDSQTFPLSCQKRMWILFGILIRCVLALWASFGTGPIAVLLAQESDQEKFFNISLNYFQGDFHAYSTRYPYVLNFIYHFVGPGMIVPRFINILLWYLGFRVVFRYALNNFDLSDFRKQKWTNRLIFFYMFMPYGMMLSQEVLREGIESLFLIISLRMLFQWLKNNRLWQIILSGLAACVAILFHAGNIAMLCVIVFAYGFWNVKGDRWRNFWMAIKSRRGLCVILLIMGALPIYAFINKIYRLDGLPNSISLATIQSFSFLEGRSDYIRDIPIVKSPIPFIFWTLYRMLYFWISPSPRFWNSPVDIFAFVVDVVPWLYLLLSYFIGWRKNSISKESKIGIVLFLIYTFVFGWGTANAGTAMRHRDMLIGVASFIGLLSLNKDSRKNQLKGIGVQNI